MTYKNYEPKPLFLERMKLLLGKDFDSYIEILKKEPVRSFRCNTLKISVEELKKRLEEKDWKIKQPFKDFPEIMIIEGKYIRSFQSLTDKRLVNIKNNEDYNINNIPVKNMAKPVLNNQIANDSERNLQDLQPGELGRALEHLLGYYYIQEIASMLPALVLNPKENERVLDLCASPGSKTTQIAARMENLGLLFANEVKIGRIKILASNTERCGVMNIIITKRDGIALCKRFKEENFLFDKILLDAPCSGEGTIRSTPKTLEMWNIKTIENLSKLQKSMIASAIEILKPNGELVYSTCTHAPEENEEVIDFALKNLNVKIEKINLPIKTRAGITKWKEKSYSPDVKLSCRIYPQDADTEGFFISKIRKLK
jgi:NOL1/NOP2/sun family putative RNA methylase